MSTPQTPALDGHPTNNSADSGPDPDLDLTPATTAPCCCSTETLCVHLEELRTALAAAGHVDDQVIDVLTGVIAGLKVVTRTHLKVVDQ